MHRSYLEDDDDFGDNTGSARTKQFSKPTVGNQRKAEPSNLQLNLQNMRNGDSSHSSDDDINTKTGRSTSSATTTQSTPKPKERTYMKGSAPKTRHINIDDDDRNVFGQNTIKPSPRREITTLREDEEENKAFVARFSNASKRKSPTDPFSSNMKFNTQRSGRRSSNRQDEHERSDSDDHSAGNKSSGRNNSRKGRHSPPNNELSQSNSDSHRGNDESDEDHDDYSKQVLNAQNFARKNSLNPDSSHTSTKQNDSSTVLRQGTSSRPNSASRNESEPNRRPSVIDEQESAVSKTSQSRPSSAKAATERQQTQSMIDIVSSANRPALTDPLTSNNEELAAALLPPSPAPRSTAKLPPRPKTTGHGPNRKLKRQHPSQYKEITSRIDSGLTPAANLDLSKSIERALQRAMKTQTLQRPQSARSRNASADSDDRRERRRRLSSAYEHVQPRVNTNRSINFDELNSSQMRADSSQSIKEGVYIEWLKVKEDQKKREQEEAKRLKEARSQSINKSNIERQIYEDARKLEQWRLEKEEQIKKKRQEEAKIKVEREQNKKSEEQRKKKDAELGFDNWKEKKVQSNLDKKDDEEEKKQAIEQRQKEKQERMFKAQKAYQKWAEGKTEKLKQSQNKVETIRGEQLTKIRVNEEQRYLSAQDAYEKWLKEKEKSDLERSFNGGRRNSFSGKQGKPSPVPFLPAGSQKNTGRVRHVVW